MVQANGAAPPFAGFVALAVLVAPGLAVADDRPRRGSLAVVVAGDEPAARLVRGALGSRLDVPFDLRLTELPPAPPPPVAPADADRRLARAQEAYVAANFEACFVALGDETEVLAHVAAGRRVIAERLLFWRVACHVGASERPAAEGAARRFVALGLEVPAIVAASNPQVADVLARAREEVLAAPRRAVRVECAAPRAVVAVDGRPERCVVPCTLDLVAGDHVLVAEADGFEPQTATVRVAGLPALVRLRPRSATPELAASQWARRWAASPAIDSSPSVLLLARAIRARRLVLLTVEQEGRGLRLRAALSVDGRLAARNERLVEGDATVGEDLAACLRDLLVRGRLLEPAPALWGRAWFWIAVGVAAAAAASVTAAAVFAPETRTQVSF